MHSNETLPTDATTDALAPHRQALAHVMEPRTLLAVFGALVMLTIVTVAVASLKPGGWEIWISLGIATAKSILVLLYFMHLRYDRGLNAFVFVCALVFLFLFLSFALMDTQEYAPLLIETPAVTAQ